MGGSGASSGISNKGKKYGTEYRTLYKSGNIKFVSPVEGATKTPMETMTKGRIYVTVDAKGRLRSITYYDKHNKRKKQIDIAGHSHSVNGVKLTEHTHKGYLHDEKGTFRPSEKEQKLIERVIKIWYYYKNK